MLILLSATIVFVDEIGVFNQDYLGVEQVKSEYTQWTVTDTLSHYNESETPSPMDYTIMSIRWLWDGLVLLAKILFATVTLYPILSGVLGVPTPLSQLISIGIVVMALYGWASWKSGRSTKWME